MFQRNYLCFDVADRRPLLSAMKNVLPALLALIGTSSADDLVALMNGYLGDEVVSPAPEPAGD
jgi:hypothetical protein